jgi:hypothetical protein
VVSFTPRQLYTQGKSLWYPLDPRAVLDAVVKRKIPRLRRESNLTKHNSDDDDDSVDDDVDT